MRTEKFGEFLLFSGAVVWSLPLKTWQLIGQTNPGQPVFDPGVVGGRNRGRLVERANRDIDF